MNPALSATRLENAAQRVADGADTALGAELFHIGATPVTIGTVVAISIVLLLTFAFTRLSEILLARGLQARGKAGEGEVRALRRLLRYALWLTGSAVALSTAGINLTALFTAGAIFAVAIGFAMQNVVENFVSGLLLLLERAIKPGDVLELDGEMVRVARMGIRTTVARTLDDEDLVVPNSRLVQSTIKNYTLRDPQCRIRARVGVAYRSDMKVVRQALLDAANALNGRLADIDPRILLIEFGASAVEWEVSIWTDNPWRVRSLRSDLLLSIWQALADAGIAIPFPQLDIHFDSDLQPPKIQADFGSAERERHS